jgi:hypothetical protein
MSLTENGKTSAEADEQKEKYGVALLQPRAEAATPASANAGKRSRGSKNRRQDAGATLVRRK